MKRSLFLLPLAAVVLFGAGCRNSSTRTGAQVPAPTANQPLTGALSGSSACAHPYYPLRNGYSITYGNRYPGGTSSYTMTASNVTNSGAKMIIAYEGGTRSEQNYACVNGAIQATGYVDLAAGMSGASATVETRSVEGELLPQNLRVGSRWSTRFTIRMNMANVLPVGTNAVGDTLNGTVAIDREAVAEESITVPAGTFRAIKVRSSTDVRIDPPPGMPATSVPPLVSYEWWVEGRGLVKTVMGQDQSIVSEATAIIVP